MNKIQKKLRNRLWGFYLLLFLIVLIFDCFNINIGYISDNNQIFYIQTIMSLVTMLAIPLALKLYDIKYVKNASKEHSNYIYWYTVRILILCLPMIINISAYYIFAHEISFFYLALILLLSTLFIYPTERRISKVLEQPSNQESI